MEVTLGLDADFGAWPPTSNSEHAQFGGLVVGARGLLHIVEAALGLGGPVYPQAVRLARWRVKLATADTADRFWHSSFAVDPFATARTVLEMRDALVEAGWHARAVPTPPQRLVDLAVAEEAGPTLPPGISDRLRTALTTLLTELPADPVIDTLVLLDARVLLPPGLGKLVSALEASGTRVSDASQLAVQVRGDLGQVQALLSGQASGFLTGDGSFTLLQADTEGGAAEVLADWLAVENERDGMVLVAGRQTGLLDAALGRRHLPRIGVSTSSPLRGLLQALPLSLATRWQPFDAVRMLEFLQMTYSPIPWEVRRRLLKLLPDCPGRGGAEWHAAIKEGLAELESRLQEEAPDRVRQRMGRARNAVAIWLDAPLADPEAGIPIEELNAVLASLTAWATRTAARDIPLAATLARHAAALQLAAQETEQQRMPRLGLERLLDSVLAEGEQDPTTSQEAAEWAVVPTPGAAWDKVRTLIWWGFDPPALPSRLLWDDDEEKALAAAYCLPWPPEVALSAASAAWRRPILRATERVLLVSISGAGGERHPLAHELASLLESAPACHPSAEALVAAPDATLAGRVLPRQAILSRSLPVPRPEWSIPARLAFARDRHSATSIEHLLGCPFAWVMQGDGRIIPGRRAEIADGERLIGLVAHRLAAELFPPGPVGDPVSIKEAAERRLQQLAEEVAAPLLQPGAAADRMRMFERLPLAVQRLARLLMSAELTVIGTEVNREAADMPEAGEAFTGTIDFLLEDQNRRAALLDLKWTRVGRRYRDRLENGLAFQLSAYARLVGAGERAAYFMLLDGDAFGASDAGFGSAVPPTSPSLSQTWQDAVAARRLRLDALGQGRLHALGVGFDPKRPGDDPDGVAVRPAPPCRFCGFGRLCGQEPVA